MKLRSVFLGFLAAAVLVGIGVMVAVVADRALARRRPSWSVACVIGSAVKPVEVSTADGRDAVATQLRQLLAPASASTERPVLATIVVIRVDGLAIGVPSTYVLIEPSAGAGRFDVITASMSPGETHPATTPKPIVTAATPSEAVRQLVEHLADVIASPSPSPSPSPIAVIHANGSLRRRHVAGGAPMSARNWRPNSLPSR